MFVLSTDGVADAFEPIGFTAYTETGADYNVGDVIRFPLVIENIGNHYSPITSRFRCPVTGLYSMHLSLASYSFNSVCVDLMHGGETLATAIAQYEEDSQGTVSPVFVCNQGDEVWAEAVRYGGQDLALDTGRRYNTFSGFLVYPI